MAMATAMAMAMAMAIAMAMAMATAFFVFFCVYVLCFLFSSSLSSSSSSSSPLSPSSSPLLSSSTHQHSHIVLVHPHRRLRLWGKVRESMSAAICWFKCQEPAITMAAVPSNPTITMAALLNPSTDCSLLQQQKRAQKWAIEVANSSGQPKECLLCEECNMYLSGPTQWADHLLSNKHRTATGAKRKKGEGIAIPKSTTFIIEQSALYDDARKQYMFSLYRRCLLRSRM